MIIKKRLRIDADSREVFFSKFFWIQTSVCEEPERETNVKKGFVLVHVSLIVA